MMLFAVLVRLTRRTDWPGSRGDTDPVGGRRVGTRRVDQKDHNPRDQS
jgi:hypothetical protein